MWYRFGASGALGDVNVKIRLWRTRGKRQRPHRLLCYGTPEESWYGEGSASGTQLTFETLPEAGERSGEARRDERVESLFAVGLGGTPGWS